MNTGHVAKDGKVAYFFNKNVATIVYFLIKIYGGDIG